jgi:hypothetical protein
LVAQNLLAFIEDLLLISSKSLLGDISFLAFNRFLDISFASISQLWIDLPYELLEWIDEVLDKFELIMVHIRH